MPSMEYCQIMAKIAAAVPRVDDALQILAEGHVFGKETGLRE